MLVLTNTVQDYAWGAVDGLTPLVGIPPTGGPEAELWVGAHPAAPSLVAGDGRLDDAVADDPARLLGPELVAAFGPRLPFLLKVLAIGGPLSIQLHPSPAQAEEGFQREEAAGIALDAPTRTYRDPHAKPEVLVALEPTWILAGLRDGDSAAALLRARDHRGLARLATLVAGRPDSRDALVGVLEADDDLRADLARAAAGFDAGDDPVDTWVARLAAAHPGDPTALAPLFMGLRLLAPGDGVFLPAGVPHAYLQGAGVELMGASDNVVRGGLTAKHVDRRALAALLAPCGDGVVALGASEVSPGVHRYSPPAPEIALHRLEPGSGEVVGPPGPGPALALATGGPATVTTPEGAADLGAGRAVLVAPAERSACRVRGPGTVWWATVGRQAG